MPRLYPLPPLADLSRAARSAGGSHTLTRPHQRFRLAPFGGSSYYSTPEPYTMSSKSRYCEVTHYWCFVAIWIVVSV